MHDGHIIQSICLGFVWKKSLVSLSLYIYLYLYIYRYRLNIYSDVNFIAYIGFTLMKKGIGLQPSQTIHFYSSMLNICHVLGEGEEDEEMFSFIIGICFMKNAFDRVLKSYSSNTLFSILPVVQVVGSWKCIFIYLTKLRICYIQLYL